MSLPVREIARRLGIATSAHQLLIKQQLRQQIFSEHSEHSLRTCATCRYHYGLTYGGHLLVCPVHPYGPTAKPCIDWEQA